MSQFNAEYLDFTPTELVDFLLDESGQKEKDSVEIETICDYLKLVRIEIDFDSEFLDLNLWQEKPRGLVSLPLRIIAVDSELILPRKRFTSLHEIAHYILPQHRFNLLHVCKEEDFSPFASVIFEQEANKVAADLLFMGSRFTTEVNDMPILPNTVKALASKYEASFEATARRIAEKTFKECLFISFELNTGNIRYTVASEPFKKKYFNNIEGKLPTDMIEKLNAAIDICDSISTNIGITTNSEEIQFRMEAFTNTHNYFAFIFPKT